MIFLFSGKLFCQVNISITSFGEGYLDSINYNGKTLAMEQTTFEQKLLKMVVKDPLSKKTKGELLRIDSLNYLFMEFDANGQEISGGKLHFNENKVEKLNIPIFDSVGNQVGNKTSAIIIYDLLKTGEWDETTTGADRRFGTYINNNRQGEWKFSRKVLGLQVCFKKETYEAGNLMHTDYLDALGKDDTQIKKTMNGQWELYNEQSLYRGDSVLHYYKTTVRNFPRHCIRFDSTGKGIILSRGIETARKLSLSWKGEKDKDKNILLYDDEKKLRLSINFLSDSELVLVLHYD